MSKAISGVTLRSAGFPRWTKNMFCYFLATSSRSSFADVFQVGDSPWTVGWNNADGDRITRQFATREEGFAFAESLYYRQQLSELASTLEPALAAV